jgi:peptidoglycan/LPS O-acetylase OafA/YrhL
MFVLVITVFLFGIVLTKLEMQEYFSQLNYLSYIRHNIVFYSDYLLPGVFENNLHPNIVNGSLWSLRYEIGCYIVLLILFVSCNILIYVSSLEFIRGFINSSNHFSLFRTHLHWISLLNCCVSFNNICFDYICFYRKAIYKNGKINQRIFNSY